VLLWLGLRFAIILLGFLFHIRVPIVSLCLSLARLLLVCVCLVGSRVRLFVVEVSQ